MILCKADTGELYLEGIVGGDWGGEGITTAAVDLALKQIRGRAVVRINSPGGSADEGVAIYNLLKRHPGGVDTHNEALAASAASIIFLAGEKRTMERGSKLMIHRAHTIAIGNQSEMVKMAEVLSLYDKDMARLYSEHMGLDEDFVLELMDEETWYDAEDAVAVKLATDMAPTVRKKTAAAAAWMKKPPQDLFEEMAVEEQVTATVHKFVSNTIKKMQRSLAGCNKQTTSK
jgi:ATP-dependent protease ClpP protease subunit